MPTVNVTISVRKMQLWAKRSGRKLGKWIRADLDRLATAGIGPDGGQYTPYETPGEKETSVNLTSSGEMLGLMKLSVKQGSLKIKPGAHWGQWQQFGTIDPDALEVLKAEAEKRRTKPRRKSRRKLMKHEMRGIRKPGGSIPPRPFMVLRPATLAKLERYWARTLDRAFKAQSLVELMKTKGGGD